MAPADLQQFSQGILIEIRGGGPSPGDVAGVLIVHYEFYLLQGLPRQFGGTCRNPQKKIGSVLKQVRFSVDHF